MKKKNWQFMYLGANQDAFAEGGAIGVAAGNTWSYRPDDMLSGKFFTQVSRSVGKFRKLDVDSEDYKTESENLMGDDEV